MADKFIVANEKGMNALPHVLRKHREHFNVYSIGVNSNAVTFQLGWDDKPDSDWGRYRGARLRVIVTDKSLAEKVEQEIRKSLGWEPLEGALAQEDT